MAALNARGAAPARECALESCVPVRWNSHPCPALISEPQERTYDFSRLHRPPANVHRFSSSSRMGHPRHRPPTNVHRFRSSSGMGHRRLHRRHDYRGGNRVMEPPKPHIIDGNRPQHHAVSAQLNRARRRGKHRGSTVTKLGGGPRKAAVGEIANALGGCPARCDPGGTSGG